MTDAHRMRLILFTRYPAPGRTKTRLVPLLGESGAAALARRLTLRTLRTARSLQRGSHLEIEIRYDGGSERAMRHWLGHASFLREQGPGDLGQRMARAFGDSSREGSNRTIIIGSDCPDLHVGVLEQAFDRLTQHPVVVGPATDGGYYLIGLSKPVPELFAGPAWGSSSVLNQSLKILQRLHLTPHLLEPLDDLDRPEDVPQWRRKVAAEEADLSRLSVIIPTWNEARNIEATLQCVQPEQQAEIIVVDGGSQDGTKDIARHQGAHVIESPRGRAVQMNNGASVATGNTLLFLHGDTILPPNWLAVAVRALGVPNIAAGAFGFGIRDAFSGRGLVELTTNLRSRWLQAPYGDQGLFLRRACFEELGGYADMPIMEDFEIVRRLRRRGRIITLREKARTSGRRWQERGWLGTTLANHAIVTGYHLGVPLERLERWYRGQLPPGRTIASGARPGEPDEP